MRIIYFPSPENSGKAVFDHRLGRVFWVSGPEITVFNGRGMIVSQRGFGSPSLVPSVSHPASISYGPRLRLVVSPSLDLFRLLSRGLIPAYATSAARYISWALRVSLSLDLFRERLGVSPVRLGVAGGKPSHPSLDPYATRWDARGARGCLTQPRSFRLMRTSESWVRSRLPLGWWTDGGRLA